MQRPRRGQRHVRPLGLDSGGHLRCDKRDRSRRSAGHDAHRRGHERHLVPRHTHTDKAQEQRDSPLVPGHRRALQPPVLRRDGPVALRRDIVRPLLRVHVRRRRPRPDDLPRLGLPREARHHAQLARPRHEDGGGIVGRLRIPLRQHLRHGGPDYTSSAASARCTTSTGS